ncbi:MULTISPECIES: helix-turn-helix domain-containing protein [Lactobacillaceae]|uniref:helix-turn-helix domain-containing protein n=1 Tax=Lactobacillaceae TaxID=33958 RepID=UPI00145664B6|nr:helix-turn-helix transcriptional regulator [Lactobacillus sp. HBUAS51381]NLR08704.1 helix-turn-helix transcriptional regulator [Lactobacillus sp. HBUAS51381]
MTVFERIKKLAKERGYSLTKLNDEAGLGTNSIYHWKTKTPGTDNLQKVANVLNVTVDYLLGEENQSTRSKKSVDLNDDDAFLTFEGKPIPEEDRELIKRLLRGK